MIFDSVTTFIDTYYINPVRLDQPYNIVSTLTYAIILIIALLCIYRWLRWSGIAFDEKFIFATIPFVVLGALVRAIYDTHMVTSDLQFLLVTPPIYVVTFLYTVAALVATRTLETKGWIRDFRTGYRNIGIVSAAAVVLLLGSWALGHNGPHIEVIFIIAGMTALATGAVWAFMKYILKWNQVSEPLFVLLILGQMLDASATSYGIDLSPVNYIEEHVVGTALIAGTGTAFSMFLLKLIVLFPAVYVLQLYRKEAEPDLWHLILFAMIVLGFAIGLRNMTQMILLG
ncbi:MULTISPECIES: DUF63 family protein [unclassified Methanoregula]|uniref:DUF63 family protein n=1 Tax=unclassified Methanoregula TaxID=2649730 RepID=UPI0009D0A895|nr:MULTISPECIES: DUF63 family protein [unclassified Methanoregula]OPX64972.1 MAG: hypothetical protein A4E33_00515 [Methanoregula sp. PtaB.Bin085]OPY35094.1 MAG: hypothetical protein A4E34_01020 [Methanoregula sp. PtaU1.Bin006]